MDEVKEQVEAEKHAGNVRSEIRNLARSEIGHLFKAGTVPSRGLDDSDALTDDHSNSTAPAVLELPAATSAGAVVYFCLSTPQFPALAKTLGKVVINDLKAAAHEELAKPEAARLPIYAIFDEFSAFAGEQLQSNLAAVETERDSARLALTEADTRLVTLEDDLAEVRTQLTAASQNERDAEAQLAEAQEALSTVRNDRADLERQVAELSLQSEIVIDPRHVTVARDLRSGDHVFVQGHQISDITVNALHGRYRQTTIVVDEAGLIIPMAEPMARSDFKKPNTLTR